MATLSQQIESWLGPGMVRIDSDSLIRVQAPRDPTARVQFIAALLALDLTP
jgi:alpha-D-ribose 1-methylphosphonate 5-triphosphate diphosphatase PhnM